MNQSDQLHGSGYLVLSNHKNEVQRTYKGTWKDGQLEGIVVEERLKISISIIEYKKGKEFGKQTFYWPNGKIENRLIAYKSISVQPENAFYTKTGKPLRAVSNNWMKYI